MSAWAGTNFKGPRVSTKERRRRKTAPLRTAERKNKNKVRQRDVRCRFPLCKCHAFGLALHVAHLSHKGMGGDPTGERSQPELMILLCIRRHRESAISIDKGTLECQPLTAAGTAGPVSWWLKLRDGEWWELAREWKPHAIERLNVGQRGLVETLRDELMTS